MKKLLIALVLLLMASTMVATAAMGEPTNYKIDIKERRIPEVKGPTTLSEMRRAAYGGAEKRDNLPWKSHPLEKCTACHKGGDELIIVSARPVPELHKVCEICSAQKAEKNKIERKAKKAPAKKIAKKAPVKKTVKKAVAKTAEPKRAAKKESKKADLSILLIPHSGKFYSVKKGDTLIAIAKRSRMHWQVLYSLNREVIGKNPNRIFPGQSLKMPNEGVFHWVNPGADPYGDRSVKKAIYGFDLPLAVKEKAYDAVTKTQGKAGEIKPGQTIRQMWFGKGLADNVLAVFPTAIEARIWRIEQEGYLYTFFRPGCTNWSWTVGKISPREIAPIEDKELTRELEAPREEIIPSEVILGPAEGFPSGAPDFEDVGIKRQRVYRPLGHDISTGAFSEHFYDSNDVSGAWGVASIFPYIKREGDDFHSYGFAMEANTWNGATGDAFDYKGDRFSIGPAYRFNAPGIEVHARVGLGKIYEEGGIDIPAANGRFESEQDTTILSAYTSYEAKNSEKVWFNKYRIYAAGDLDLDHDGKAEFSNPSGDFPLAAQPSDKTSVRAGVNANIYQFDRKNTVSLAGGLGGIYYAENSIFGLRPEAGFNFFDDTIEVRGNYTKWSEGPDSIGAGVTLNLSKFIARMFHKDDLDKGFDKPVSKEESNQRIRDILYKQ